MKRIRCLLAAAVVCAMAGTAGAATYYVDATGGVDTNDGLSQGTAWKTVAKVNGSTFSAGDSILFKRGQVWNESLVPPSSGASGNPIMFDAYGTGEAPTLTGYVGLPSASWTLDSGNIWKTSITSTSFNYVLFGYVGSDGTVGSVWGTKFTSGKSALVAPYQFFFTSNVLYVYSPVNPATYYGSMAAMLMTNGQIIYINGKSWITIQHFKVTYFDTYGVRIGGASDHITIANVYSDGVIPAGTTPHGFYVNVSPAATDMKFYNVDAHRNYNGFRFDGPGSGIVLKNCRAYGNRNHGLEDSMTGGGSTYSYCHFYANGLGVVVSTDTVGGTNGGNNIPAYTAPATTSFQKYPARITLTVDDPGLIAGAETYIDSILPLFDARGLQLSVAIVTGYDLSNTLISKFQSWIDAGRDVVSHSWSHQYFLPASAMTIKYTGTGSAATMTVSGNTLTTTVTGGPGGENLSFDLTDPSYNTVSSLVTAINTHGGYTAGLVIATAYGLGDADAGVGPGHQDGYLYGAVPKCFGVWDSLYGDGDGGYDDDLRECAYDYGDRGAGGREHQPGFDERELRHDVGVDVDDRGAKRIYGGARIDREGCGAHDQFGGCGGAGYQGNAVYRAGAGEPAGAG